MTKIIDRNLVMTNMTPANLNKRTNNVASQAFQSMMIFMENQSKIDRNTNYQISFIARQISAAAHRSWWQRSRARKELEACVTNLSLIADNLFVKAERDQRFMEDLKND